MRDFIKIYPNIEFAAQCPADQANLTILSVAIPGMRNLANSVCPICSSRYYIDLPVGQALWSPITLNQETAETHDSHHMWWFSEWLKDSFLQPVLTEEIPVVHKFFDAKRIVIVNCLDYLYGHSLLKLLNVQRHLEHSPDLGCCVLVPTQLVHLVPKGVAEIWEMPIKIKDGRKWYSSLSEWINQRIIKYDECFLSLAYSHPSNKIYDLNRFVQNLPDISNQTQKHEPIILFSYREDRFWGRSLNHQQRNIQYLYDKLSGIFPNMIFVLIGFGFRNRIRMTSAKLIDLRTDRFDINLDRLWMAYMRSADCAVGVHGSNMLLPSGLAKSTTALVPYSRVGNSVQDFLFNKDLHDIRDGLLLYRMLYGNEELSDIKPEQVTDMIANVVSYARINLHWFKAGEYPNAIANLTNSFQSDISVQAQSHLRAQQVKPQPIKHKIKINLRKFIPISV